MLKMMTIIKERYIYDVIVEISKDGTFQMVMCDKKGKRIMVHRSNFKINNTDLSYFSKNYYNVVRSNKKHCQEYGGW